MSGSKSWSQMFVTTKAASVELSWDAEFKRCLSQVLCGGSDEERRAFVHKRFLDTYIHTM